MVLQNVLDLWCLDEVWFKACRTENESEKIINLSCELQLSTKSKAKSIILLLPWKLKNHQERALFGDRSLSKLHNQLSLYLLIRLYRYADNPHNATAAHEILV